MSRVESKLNNLAEAAGTREASWATVRSDLETLGNDIARLGASSLAEGQERVSQELERLKARVGEIAQNVKQKREDSVEAAVEGIRKRPLTSVAGAFAIGVFLASLRRR